ncbi:MAG: M24 family metallopeptidase [Gaiellaceae bacterium]
MSDVLIYGDSIGSPAMRHEVPVPVPDDFVYAEHDGRRYVAVYSHELTRLGGVDSLETHPFEELGRDELVAAGLSNDEVLAELALRACRHLGLTSASVPGKFPLSVADHLRANGIDLTPDVPLFDGRRRRKNEAELAGIRRAQRACEAAMDAARALLRRADATGSVLMLDAEPLTCERIKAAVGRVFADHGATGEVFIVSHGPQTAVGHEMGSGRIAAGEPVVLDLFPRDSESGCYSDMTRTFVVGTAPDELREYHRLVLEALKRSHAALRPGVVARDFHLDVCRFFEEHGYPTQLSKEPGTVLEEGFFHGLGHGVGLEVHEKPSLGMTGHHELVVGDVVTLEPGLYRPGFGGCRLEDIVLVTEDGAENLTDYPYDLEP